MHIRVRALATSGALVAALLFAAQTGLFAQDKKDEKKNQPKLSKEQIQEAQGRMVKLQEELATRTVEASAGGGMVKVTANGRHEIVAIHIDPQVIDPQDPEMLEDLILAAVNVATQKVDEAVQQELGGLTGGLKIPGLF